MLFSDLKGFTAHLRQHGARRDSPRSSSEYLTEDEQGHLPSSTGTIDKFIGDAVMKFPLVRLRTCHPKQQARAGDTLGALAMNEALDRLAMSWTDERAVALKMRIGIHHGPAVVGNFGVGSSDRIIPPSDPP